MTDTVRTEADLLSAFQDNTAGLISAQNVRDLVVTNFAGLANLNADALTSGTVSTARLPDLTGTYLTPSGDGGGLTNLNASALTSGTVSAGLLPDLSGIYLAPSGNGSGLTNLNATALTSGTVSTARLPDLSGIYLAPSGNGSGLTNLNATALTTGTVAVARLAIGTPAAGKYPDGTGTWTTLPASNPGTVTSVALATSGVLHSVSGSPVTGSGTLSLNLLTQTANTILAGPTTGAAAAPTMRVLVAADLPAGDSLSQYALLAGRSGGQTLSGDTASGGSLTLQSTSNATKGVIFLNGTSAQITVAGNFSRPGGTNSEQFGLSSSAAGTNSLAVGSGALSGAGNGNMALGRSATIADVASSSLAVGYQASVTANVGTALGTTSVAGAGSVAVGTSASASSSSSVTIGNVATSATSGTVVIGASASATNAASVAVGKSATAAFNATAVGNTASAAFSGAMALGMGATATATNQCVLGGATGASTGLYNYYFGGVTQTTTSPITLNANGGSGTDIAGANLSLCGGRPAGSGVGGSVKIQTAPAGASGVTLRVLVDRVEVDQQGNVDLAVGGALTTTATDGFTYIPGGAGPPTGVPTAKTGRTPMYYDQTNNKMYIYNSGWKASGAFA